MKRIVNMHIIETDEGRFKFKILHKNVVITNKKEHDNMKEAIEAAIELSDFIEKNALIKVKDMKEWES